MINKLDAIYEIRNFNRFYTNILGLLDQYILDSGYSLTEVRVLLEISKLNHCTANTLITLLKIDPSYMSRIIKNLEKSSLIAKIQSEQDNRVNFIMLTEKGTSTIQRLNKKSDEQILNLIEHLDSDEIYNVLNAMKVIKNKISKIHIRNFRTDDIDYVISSHKILYKNQYNLSTVFCDYVDRGVHNFVKNFDKDKDCMLIPEIDGTPVGSIAIAKIDDKTAQLRYYLLDHKARGQGLGHKLVDMALRFCREKGYTHIFLETISALKTARHIYKSKGFQLTYTHKNKKWGKDILEERWELDL